MENQSKKNPTPTTETIASIRSIGRLLLTSPEIIAIALSMQGESSSVEVASLPAVNPPFALPPAEQQAQPEAQTQTKGYTPRANRFAVRYENKFPKPLNPARINLNLKAKRSKITKTVRQALLAANERGWSNVQIRSYLYENYGFTISKARIANAKLKLTNLTQAQQEQVDLNED